MQYLLLIYANEADHAKQSEAAMTTLMTDYRSFTQSIIQGGQFKAGDALQPTATATTVRVREGKTLTTDGPFAETREQLGGYYLIEARTSTRRLASRRAYRRQNSAPSRFDRSWSTAELLAEPLPRVSDNDLDRVFRDEAGRVLATLIRLVGDFESAEEALQDACAAAAEQWRRTGVPANPRAWLVDVGRNKSIDRLRRQIAFRAKHRDLEAEAAITRQIAPSDDEDDGGIADDMLRLIFTCCHPALNPEAQVALTLRAVLRPDHGSGGARLPGRRGDHGAAPGPRQGQDS